MVVQPQAQHLQEAVNQATQKIPYSSSKHHSQQQQGIAKTKSSKTSIAQSVAQRIANAIKGPSSKGNTFNIASPQQTPAPPPPPKKDASLKSNRSPEDENKKSRLL